LEFHPAPKEQEFNKLIIIPIISIAYRGLDFFLII